MKEEGQEADKCFLLFVSCKNNTFLDIFVTLHQKITMLE